MAQPRRTEPPDRESHSPADSSNADRRRRIEKRKRRGVRARSKQERPRRLVLRAVLTFALLLAAFYAFEYTRLARGPVRRAYLQWIARSSALILNVFGHDARVTKVTVSTSEFSVKIVRGCDALDPAAAFAAAVLASPVAWRRRLIGIVAGIPTILAINLVRVVSLFYIGIYFPSAFDVMHREVWQGVLIVLAVVFWFVWVQWATKERGATETTGTV